MKNLFVAEENTSPPKIRKRLSEKFDEIENLNDDNSPDEASSSAKKSKLN